MAGLVVRVGVDCPETTRQIVLSSHQRGGQTAMDVKHS